MEEKKEGLFINDPDEPISLTEEEEVLPPPEKRFGWKNLTFLVLVILLALLTAALLLWNMLREEQPSEGGDSAVSNFSVAASDSMTHSDLASEPEQTSSVVSDSSDSSAETSQPEIPDEEYHGWIINNLGYTYLYHGVGVEQFNYSDTTLNKYMTSVRELASNIPDGTSVYCMPVPTRIGYLYSEISNEIKREDDFFNSSQQTFLDTVQEKIGSGISTVNLYTPFLEAYQAGKELFYHTDANWTADAAYLAYQQFCTKSGNTPVSLAMYDEKRMEGFLGSFYTATGSDILRRNADTFRYYQSADTEASTVTLYQGGSVYKNYSLASNAVSGYAAAYSVYLGRTGAHFKIESPCTSHKKLLIIGDNSAAALIPYLVSNYSEIHYVDASEYKETFSSLFQSNTFHDVLITNYVTNAVKGAYPTYLATMAGIQ